MKFPKLPRFFHKRSQSDSALYRRAQPDAALPPRPASASFTHTTVPPASTHTTALSDFLSTIPTAPLDVAARHVSLSTASTCSTGQISAASQPVVIDALTRRILELQDALHTHEPSADRISSLERTLDAARDTTRDLQTRNAQLAHQLSTLTSSLASKDEALTRLDAAHTHLQSLMRLPILTTLLAHVDSGADPETALIDALHAALRTPGSPWRTLLEPVTGTRSPADYLAQVRCTLRARREGRDWRLRAAFWRAHAKEEGRHAETVTPSGSLLEEVSESGKTGEDVRVRVEVRREVVVEGDTLPAVVPEPIAQADDSPVSPPNVDALPSTTQDLPPSHSKQEPADRPGPYANLPPLASVTFRASHSIRSLPSHTSASTLSHSSPKTRETKRTSLTRAAEHLFADEVPELEGMVFADTSADSGSGECEDAGPVLVDLSGSGGAGEDARRLSGSDSSTDSGPSSGKYKEPVTADSGASLSKPKEPVLADASTDSRPASSGSTSHLQVQSLSRTDATRRTSVSLSDLTSSSWDYLSSIIERSLSFSSSPPLPLPPTASPPSSSPPPPSSTPPPLSDPPISPAKSPHPSPAKKSRLPLLKTRPNAAARLMRRLSKQISRPVLVDSTNGAAVGGCGERPGGLVAKKDVGVGKKDVAVGKKEKEKENGERARVRVRARGRNVGGGSSAKRRV